jgi:transposase
MEPHPEDGGKRKAGQRRRFSKEFKRQVVEETLAGDASVASIALRHRLNTNLVFTWRRRYLRGLVPATTKSVKMLPVTISDPSTAVPAVLSESPSVNKSARRSRPAGVIEIELNGVRIHLKGAVDAAALRVVLTVLGSR